MPRRTISPAYIAAQIRRVLKDGGSAPHAEGVQWFFKEVVKSRGWYTGELRKVAHRFQRTIYREKGQDFLLQICGRLFSGRVLEERIMAVLMLEKLVDSFGDSEFRLFESWLSRIRTWADHDALVHYLISPMISAKPARMKKACGWAKSRNRWHRRAACVALIRNARSKTGFKEITTLSDSLLSDQDDMVQKGLGWLLRETAKADPERTVAYLLKIRDKAPRLVMRTACEPLGAELRRTVLETRSARAKSSV